MKRFHIAMTFVLIAISVSVTGCDDDIVISEEEKNPANSNETEIAAHIDMGSHMSRTALGDMKDGIYPVLWSENDEIRVFNSNGTKTADFKLVSGSGTQSAVFRGGMVINQSPAYSAYPSKSAFMSSANIVGASIPEKQSYVPGGVASNVMPMVGVSTNYFDFMYRNLCGIIRLDIVGEGNVSKIILMGNDGEILSGRVAMAFTSDGTPVPATGEESAYTDFHLIKDNEGAPAINIDFGGKNIVFNKTNPVTIYIAVLPQTFKKGFTLFLKDADNEGTFVKSSGEITVRRSQVLTMKTFDYKQPEIIETANCYVVTKAGPFVIPAFCRGNRPVSSRLDVDENGRRKTDDLNTNGHEVAADYLWTDNPGAIKNIFYIPGKNGSIVFNVVPDADGNAPKGNTVVALYDKETKEILWSWHIWMSEYKEVYTDGKCGGQDPTADGFSSDVADGKMVIMDRNLGAISADKNDGWKTYGLYYQMGRKDPFIGAKGGGLGYVTGVTVNDDKHFDKEMQSYTAYESSPFGDYTNYTEWNKMLAPRGWELKLGYIDAFIAVKNPMMFASNPGQDSRWTKQDKNTKAPFVSNGDHEDFWNRTKTINDPCPAGWTIIGERKGAFYKNPTITATMTNGVYGADISCIIGGTKYTVWWPAAGFRSVHGRMGNLGEMGVYWLFDHISNVHGGHYWQLLKVRDGKTYTYKATFDCKTNHAGSMRCVRANQTNPLAP